MAKATVRWLNQRNFVGVDSTGHSVVLSGQKNGIGVSPSQMLLVALAACSSVDVVEILEKKRKKLTLLEVIASGEQDPEVYAELIRERPHQVQRVYIRNVTGEAPENDRFAAVFDGIEPWRWQLFDTPETLELPATGERNGG